MFRWGCQKWTLCASEVFFTKHRFLKKKVLSESFSVFRRQFSRFEAKNFCQVFKFCIQLVWKKISRESFAGNKLFLIDLLGFYAFQFFVIIRSFLLAVLSELNFTFRQDCLHEKPFLWKKNFLNCFSLFRPKVFRVYSKMFPSGLSELHSLKPEEQSMRERFSKTMFFFKFRIWFEGTFY